MSKNEVVARLATGIVRYRLLEMFLDGFMLAAAFTLAFFLRFDFSIPTAQLENVKTFILPILGAKLTIFYLLGLYYRMWRYTSMSDLYRIIGASIVGTMAVTVIIFAIYRADFPRSVVLLDGLLTVFFIGGARIASRSLSSLRLRDLRARRAIPILIFGAGTTGESIIREIAKSSYLSYHPVGIIDDDPRKQGLRIHGIKVLGTREQLPSLINNLQIEEVMVCTPTVSREVIRDIFFKCQKSGVKCRTLPGVYQLIDGTVSVQQIRNIGIEDILGREPVKVDLKSLAGYISGRTVMVTGAGGSIGSEICRQLSLLRPSSLIMFDQSESNLFQIEQELLKERGFTSTVTVIGDLVNHSRTKSVLLKYRPSVIFHAAAYKHVPMMETNLIEAVVNNVLSTRTLAEAAILCGTERFVLISTDKAVEPVSIMGISKALAEKVVQLFPKDSQAKFMSVRFGNVIDSSGSVVPIFRQQIAHGGPVTVTQPEMTRYFMTIPEAVQLVILAGALGRGGEIFVLDMGEPVSILELARTMIKLSGFEPDKDIPIEFTGIRPGEKLYEKWFWDYEMPLPTQHERLMMVENSGLDIPRFKEDLKQLEEAVNNGDEKKIHEVISVMCVHHLGMNPS